MAKPPGQRLAEQVGKAARRRLRGRRSAPAVWLGLGMAGAIGWSVALPTLLGAALGRWLDRHYPGGHSWTLTLLVAGLTLGCFSAWRWTAREQRAMEAAMEADNGADDDRGNDLDKEDPHA